MNVIWAPCGSGKTTAARKIILPQASSPKKAIYLIDTQLGNERLALEDGLIMPPDFYADSVVHSFFPSEEDLKDVCVTTYAQFGSWCRQFPRFEECFEYIICDEPQNLVNFSEIGKWRPNEVNINVHRIARQAICDAVNRGNVTVVGITATPKPLEKLKCQLKPIPIDRTNLHHYIERSTVRFANLESIMDSLSVGMRGGLYIKHVKPMMDIGDMFRARGFNPLLLWSLSNKDYTMNEEQLRARQYIIEHEAVPDEYDVFLFNATAETSINLRSHMDFFIAYNTSETSITQSRGRYRGDLDKLYIYQPQGFVVVPESYLNRWLNRDDLKRLRAELNLWKDADHHVISIDDMLTMFSDCGYNVDGKKVNRRQVFIIRKG